MAKVHRLKTVKPFFDDVRCNRKTFEVRKNDRDYAEGDYLVLDETYDSGEYTEVKPIVRLVTYLLPGGLFGIEPGHVVLGIDELADPAATRTILDVAPPRATPVSPQDGGK